MAASACCQLLHKYCLGSSWGQVTSAVLRAHGGEPAETQALHQQLIFEERVSRAVSSLWALLSQPHLLQQCCCGCCVEVQKTG